MLEVLFQKCYASLKPNDEREKMVECGSCLGVHEVEDDPCYCVVCSNNYDSGCMNEINGEPVCFGCSEKKGYKRDTNE